jgi:hypothetical protein
MPMASAPYAADDTRWLMLEPTRRYRSAARMQCRYCSSEMCHRATRHGLQDFLFRLIGMFPWRCTLCGARFYRRKRADG